MIHTHRRARRCGPNRQPRIMTSTGAWNWAEDGHGPGCDPPPAAPGYGTVTIKSNFDPTQPRWQAPNGLGQARAASVHKTGTGPQTWNHVPTGRHQWRKLFGFIESPCTAARSGRVVAGVGPESGSGQALPVGLVVSRALGRAAALWSAEGSSAVGRAGGGRLPRCAERKRRHPWRALKSTVNPCSERWEPGRTSSARSLRERRLRVPRRRTPQPSGSCASRWPGAGRAVMRAGGRAVAGKS